MVMSALELAKSGENKNKLLALLTNSWELLSCDKLKLGITNYYLLQWSGQYLKDNIHDGLLVDDDITYCVIYRGCTPSQAFKSPQVRVSFRASSVGNVAIIQPTHRAAYGK